MQRRVLAMLVLALLLAAVPTAAQAKGASAATISGGGPRGRPGRWLIKKKQPNTHEPKNEYRLCI
jgi:hypothetical protein